MNCKEIEVMVSGYLDGELTQQEQQQVRVHVETCDSCRKVLEEMGQVKRQMGELSYPKTDLEVLEALEQDLVAKTSAGTGWFVLILGVVFVTGMAVINFFTADDMPWYEKLGVGLLVMGPTFLLACVTRQRLMTYKNDKYRRVKL